MPFHTADSTLADIGHATAWGGGGIAVLGGLTANEIAAFCGGAAALGGLLVQVYFKRRDERRKKADEQRKQELHQLETRRLKRLLGEHGA